MMPRVVLLGLLVTAALLAGAGRGHGPRFDIQTALDCVDRGGAPILGPEAALLQPRRERREMLAQRLGEPLVGRAHRKTQLAGALGEPDLHLMIGAGELQLYIAGRG